MYQITWLKYIPALTCFGKNSEELDTDSSIFTENDATENDVVIIKIVAV